MKRMLALRAFSRYRRRQDARSWRGPRIMSHTRREVLAELGMAALGAMLAGQAATLGAEPSAGGRVSPGNCPFRLSVINDEISQDFEQACKIAAQDFGLRWIELRTMWNKNITELSA